MIYGFRHLSQRSRYILIISIMLGVAAAVFILYSSQFTNSKIVEYNNYESPSPQAFEAAEKTAYFAIYTHGLKRDFSASRYHNLSPNVYLEPPFPNVIHVKKAGITWSDFFATLPMSVSQECLVTGTQQQFCSVGATTLKFYINGEYTAAALTQAINESDTLLISFGSESEEEITEQLKAAFADIPAPTPYM